MHGIGALDEIEELHACPRVVLKHAEHRTGDRHRVLLLDTAHRHAQVRGFHDDSDPERTDLLPQRFGDLIREPLLYLQPARKHVHEARDLAQSNNLALGNVGDVALAEERQQVVLAQAVEVDVLHDQHLVIIDREERVVEHRVDIGGITVGQEPKRLLHSLRRVDQPLTRRVFSQFRQELTNDVLHVRILPLAHR